ncbi:MAG: YXWGXW repeat-containing protein [Planctomycetes bacterium]|nr:YXWGXW repeat-containing protein [Planctomycetota bacterium]
MRTSETFVRLALLGLSPFAGSCVAYRGVVVHEPRPVIVRPAPIPCPPPVVVAPVPCPPPVVVAPAPCPPPVVVLPAPTPPVVTRPWLSTPPPAAPALPCEIRPKSPHKGWIWCAGYYDWTGNRYVLVPGRWAAPPFRGARFEAGHWIRESRGWRWVEARFVR